MTTRRNTKNLLASSTVAVLLAGALTACSGGGGSVEDFCNDGKALTDGSALNDVDSSDPEAAKAAFGDLVDQVKDIDAPDDIKDDWDTLVTAFEGLNDGFQDADADDPEALAAVFEDFNTPEVQTASDNVSAYTEENCEA